MRFTNKASTNTRSHSTTAEIQRNTPKNEALGNTQHCIPSKGSNKQSKLTVLSTLIWEGRWELALKRLKSTQYRHEAWQEIDLPCFPSGKYEGMPLHLASAMRPLPPASFIQELLGAFPEACRIRQTSWELLPLHLASDLSNHQMTGCALESTLAKTLDSYEKESNSKIIEETLPKLVLMNSNSEPVQIRCSVLEASRSMYEYANHAKIVDMLLKNYSQSIFARENISGMLPLHIAALTASSENGIVSATSSVVLDILLKAAPETRVLVDGYGDTPIHLAWREARFCCYQCGNKGPCLCQKHKLSVPKRYIHPLLRDELSLQGTATSTHTGLETPNTGSQKCNREKYTDEERQNDNKDDYEDDRNDMPTFKGEQSGMRRENNQEDLNKKWSGLLCINNIGKKKRENTDRLSIDSEGKSKCVDEDQLPNIVKEEALAYLNIKKTPSDKSNPHRFYLDPSTWQATTFQPKVVKTPSPRAKTFEKYTMPIHQKNETPDERLSLDFDTLLHDLTTHPPARPKTVPNTDVKTPSSRAAPASIVSSVDEEPNTAFKKQQQQPERVERLSLQKIFSASSIVSTLPKNAALKLRLQLSELRRPTSGNVATKNNKPPNPYYEVFVTTTKGREKYPTSSNYKSYPLWGQREGEWEESIIDLGKPRYEITDLQIGIRVMHCSKKGSEEKFIGLCRAPLKNLQLQQQPDQGYPILKGFEVMGWLRVKSFKIE